jgi:feruloyl esterase
MVLINMAKNNIGQLSMSLFILALSVSAHATTNTSASLFDKSRCAQIIAPKNVIFNKTPNWVTKKGLPEFCQVQGQIDRRSQFEMRLPIDWNGRFVMAGCGGFCGSLLADKPGYSNSINEALKKGYAAISHDGGHNAKSWETHWAYKDQEALEIFAHKILPIVTQAGTEITESLYGKPPHHKYFSGCSNGGRLGMMAAQRYPDLFDGIAAGGSIYSLSEIAGLWGNWMIKQTSANGEIIFDRTKTPLIKTAITQQCDHLDGLTDGIITDPRQCHLDFSQLQCNNQQESAICLTTKEADMLNKLYGGVKDGKGNTVAPSLSYGSEHYALNWIFGTQENPAWGVKASEGYRQMLSNDLFGKDDSKPQETDTMLEWISKSSVPQVVDAIDTDLSGLKQHNTKLLIYHGWSDPLIIPQPMVNYYEDAAIAAKGLDTLKENARLFMIPGWGHCWEKTAEAPDQFDPLDIVAQWVESGIAPTQFVATQVDENAEVIRSRPICAYPNTSTLIKGKDPSKAESFQCSANLKH